MAKTICLTMTHQVTFLQLMMGMRLTHLQIISMIRLTQVISIIPSTPANFIDTFQREDLMMNGKY